MRNSPVHVFAAAAAILFAGGLLSLANAAKNPALESAKELAKKGDWEQAIMYVQTAIGRDENNAEAWGLWADGLLALGDTADAIETYQKAISLDPKQPSAALELTRYYIVGGRVDEAEKLVARAEKADEKGKIDEIKAARGLLFAQKGDFAGATKILVNVAAKNKKNPIYPVALARLYNEKGVKEQAVIYYADAWKLAPGDLGIAYEFALVLQDLERYQEALDLFKVVQDKDPNNKTVDFMIGRLYYAAKRWGEAGLQFQKAVEKRQDHFLSHYLLGKSTFEYSKSEKVNFYRQSEVAFRRANELRPNRPEVLAGLAEVLNIEGRLAYQFALSDSVEASALANCDSAIAYFREVYRLAPETPAVFGYMARVWLRKGELDSTIFYSKKQLELTPDEVSDFSRLVSSQQKKKDFAGLVETLKPPYDRYDWMIRKSPTDTIPTAQDKFLDKYCPIYASSLIEIGQTDSAREILKTLIGYAPKWKQGYNLIIYTYLKRSDYAGAVAPISAALKELPNDADLWLQLGDCEYFANPKSRAAIGRAKAAYQEAADRGNRDAKQKLETLSAIR